MDVSDEIDAVVVDTLVIKIGELVHSDPSLTHREILIALLSAIERPGCRELAAQAAREGERDGWCAAPDMKINIESAA